MRFRYVNKCALMVLIKFLKHEYQNPPVTINLVFNKNNAKNNA